MKRSPIAPIGVWNLGGESIPLFGEGASILAFALSGDVIKFLDKNAPEIVKIRLWFAEEMNLFYCPYPAYQNPADEAESKRQRISSRLREMFVAFFRAISDPIGLLQDHPGVSQKPDYCRFEDDIWRERHRRLLFDMLDRFPDFTTGFLVVLRAAYVKHQEQGPPDIQRAIIAIRRQSSVSRSHFFKCPKKSIDFNGKLDKEICNELGVSASTYKEAKRYQVQMERLCPIQDVILTPD